MNTIPTYPTETVKRPGTATAALVLGITGAALALIPILGLFGLILGVLAVIFGLVTRKKARGFAWTGIITGVLAVALSILGLVIVTNAVNDLDSCIKAIDANLQSANPGSSHTIPECSN